MSFLKSRKFIVTFGILIFLIISGFKFLNDKFIIGFKHPESVYCYNDYIFVSNIGSSPVSKNLDGFITKLDRYGNILEYKFIDRLQAPKGIYAYGSKLYIADLNRICIADIDTKKKKCINIKDSSFLNDIVYVNGGIYVTDTVKDRIYVVKNNRSKLFFEKKGLSPNGIIFLKSLNAFAVVSFNNPAISLISIKGTLLNRVYLHRFKGFDGISLFKNRFFFSDYRSGSIVSADLNFKDIRIIKKFKTPAADISVCKNRILVPLIKSGKLYIGNIEP